MFDLFTFCKIKKNFPELQKLTPQTSKTISFIMVCILRKKRK